MHQACVGGATSSGRSRVRSAETTSRSNSRCNSAYPASVYPSRCTSPRPRLRPYIHRNWCRSWEKQVGQLYEPSRKLLSRWPAGPGMAHRTRPERRAASATSVTAAGTVPSSWLVLLPPVVKFLVGENRRLLTVILPAERQERIFAECALLTLSGTEPTDSQIQRAIPPFDRRRGRYRACTEHPLQIARRKLTWTR
jgi:hypothetical protein